ncbi:hypothetical protein [Streptomyces sp. NBRC 110028]|uniref:hypothetical protein n=1 Tax=Streptomyces sp. NBRC 110028 TaxID=1621260 RepID=UPI0006E300B6|nr:hypothetical protein [Streptomyces sp. NBRC 110028]
MGHRLPGGGHIVDDHLVGEAAAGAFADEHERHRAEMAREGGAVQGERADHQTVHELLAEAVDDGRLPVPVAEAVIMTASGTIDSSAPVSTRPVRSR